MADKAIVLSGGALTEKVLTQANSHGSPDTDSGTTALHHTLGTGANQAAAGDHTHNDLSRIVGEMVLWSTNTAPNQWLLCYGQSVSRSTYAALFAVIGTTFGSVDLNSFNLPDLRGRLPLGKDNMGGTSANRVTATEADLIGQSSGAETHTLTTTELPSHTHPITYTNNLLSGGGGSNIGGSGLTDNTNATGGGSPHNNMPPYLTLNYIIFAGA